MTTTRRRQYGTHSVHPHHNKGCPHHDAKDVTRCAAAPTSGGWGCRIRGTIEHGFTRDGARKRITVTGKTEAEVKRKLRDKAREIARDEAETVARTTVKTWATEWLAMTATEVQPKTHTTDKGAVRYIVGTIGHKRLEQLTPADVRALRTAVTSDGLTTSTALRYHGTLMRILKKAIEEGHRVPARVVAPKTGPKASVNDRRAIPLPDSLALLSVAAELPHGSRWAAALLQGMRQGECLGLTWAQVNLVRETLTISWQLQALPYRVRRDRKSGFLIPDGYEARQLEGRMHLVRPKTKAGWRVIPLVPWMTNALTTWQQVAPASPHNLVWPALDGGPADAVVDRDEWHVMQDTVGVRHPNGRHYTVHEARHATATLLLELGVPESVRVAIMGHSSVASTNQYEHVDTTLAREALARVAQRLELT